MELLNLKWYMHRSRNTLKQKFSSVIKMTEKLLFETNQRTPWYKTNMEDAYWVQKINKNKGGIIINRGKEIFRSCKSH